MALAMKTQKPGVFGIITTPVAGEPRPLRLAAGLRVQSKRELPFGASTSVSKVQRLGSENVWPQTAAIAGVVGAVPRLLSCLQSNPYDRVLTQSCHIDSTLELKAACIQSAALRRVAPDGAVWPEDADWAEWPSIESDVGAVGAAWWVIRQDILSGHASWGCLSALCSTRTEVRRHLLLRQGYTGLLLEAHVRKTGSAPENLRILLGPRHGDSNAAHGMLPSDHLIVCRGQRCSGCGHWAGRHRFVNPLPALLPADLQRVGGWVFAAFKAVLAEDKLTGAMCGDWEIGLNQPVRESNCRLAMVAAVGWPPASLAWRVPEHAPPLVALEIPDSAWQDSMGNQPGRQVVMTTRIDAEVREVLQVPMGPLRQCVAVGYELLSLLLYDGGHYCTDVRDAELGWLRFDGLAPGGVGQPVSSPTGMYKTLSGWWPVAGVWQRVIDGGVVAGQD